MTRRDLLRSSAAMSAAEAMFPGILFAAAGGPRAGAGETGESGGGVTWRKTPCRFCGVGCGLLVGLDNGRAVAVKGRPGEPGEPRPVLREGLPLGAGPLREGPPHAGDGAPGRQARAGAHEGGPRPGGVEDGRDHQGPRQGLRGPVRLGAVDDSRRLRGLEAHEGRDRHQQPGSQRAPLHVERGDRLHDQLRARRADGLLRRHRPRRRVRAVGQQHGRDAPGALLPPARAAPEEPRGEDHRPGHPLDSHQHGRRPIHPLQTSDRPGHRQRDLPRDHPHRRRARGLRARHVSFHEGKTNIGYGLEDRFAFKDEPKTIDLARYRELLADYSVEKVEALSGVPARELRYLAALYADPKKKVMSLWCMGFNQHTRGTWINNLVYNIHLLVGKVATPGQQPVLADRPAERLRYRARGGHAHPAPASRRRHRGEGAQAGRRDLGRAGGAHRGQAHLPHGGDVPRGGPRRHPLPVDPGHQSDGDDAEAPPLPRRAQERRPLHRGLRRLPHAHQRRGGRDPALRILDRARGDVGQLGAAHAAFRADAAAARRGHERYLTDDRGGATPGLREALSLERGDAHPGDLINISKCRGYMDCIRGCVKENNQDRRTGIQYIRIHEHRKGQMDFGHAEDDFFHEVPAAGHFYIGTQCFHCQNPPCVDVCPVKATWMEPDGIVVVDYNWCIGCRYCIAACPYDARRFNWSEPVVPADELNPDQHYLGNRLRKRGVVEKCTFCIQRSREGRNPACVEACPTGARVFGNLLDPDSEIRWVLANKKVFRLKEDLGTEPKFWYYMD